MMLLPGVVFTLFFYTWSHGVGQILNSDEGETFDECITGEVKTSEKDCFSYHVCSLKLWYMKTCPKSRPIFDRVEQYCISEAQFVISTISEKSCNIGQRYPSDDITSYLECNSLKVLVKKCCPFCQRFDHMIRKCIRPPEAICSEIYRVSVKSYDIDDKDPLVNVPSTSQDNGMSVAQMIVDDPSRLSRECDFLDKKPDVEDCTQLYKCNIRGQWALETCSFFHLYDIITNTCVLFFKACCAIDNYALVNTDTWSY